MQAIITRYHGPTDHRGSRITARAYAGAVTVPWDHALNPFQNHHAAAQALSRRMGWTSPLIGASLPDDRGYAFVPLP